MTDPDNTGWMLDIYMKDRDAWHKHPKATFQFLACALEWQELWLKVMYGPYRK